MKEMLKKLSSLLVRGHHALERRLAQKKAVAPQLLDYKVTPGAPVIVHVNGNFVVGGTSQLIADIVQYTSDRYNHHIVVPGHPKPLAYQPLSIAEYGLQQLPLLFEWLEKNRPSLVHIHYWVRPKHRFYDFSLWYQAVFRICAELGLKVIQNINVPTAPFHNSSVVHNVFVSEYVRTEFNDSSLPSSVIYPGSDLRHFSSLPGHIPPSDTIGMVYRLDDDKLDPQAIEVFISAVKKNPLLYVYIIGGGIYLERYKSRVKEEDLQKNFEFTGFVSYESLPSYYNKLGLVVAPVHDESFGQVTPFAMSMSLPVAGYDTGALAEILDSKEMLVPFGDINALADKIVEIMNDNGKRKRIGEANKERVKCFSLEKMISSYDELYKFHIN